MELYIAPNGDDKARGTLDTPLKTLSAAVKRMAAAEDGYWDGRAEIILRGGVYPVDKTIDIATNMPLTIRACTGEEAVLDGVPSSSRFAMGISLAEEPEQWPNSTLSRYFGVAICGSQAGE